MVMNQDIIHAPKKPANKYGEYTYNQSSIKCRIQYSVQKFITSSGNQVMSKAIIYTSVPLQINDKVKYEYDTFVVSKVDTIVNVLGVIDHYRSYLT